jgi:hypothetical protein
MGPFLFMGRVEKQRAPRRIRGAGHEDIDGGEGRPSS